MTFTRFNLHHHLVTGLANCGYVTPTPIQAQAIPEILIGHDLLGLAQTGTGKTVAFVLPLLQRLTRGKRGTPRALIVAPTRELVEQIHLEILRLAKGTGIRSVAVYGGVSKRIQQQKIQGGVDIIVACPGRLLDHLSDNLFTLAKIETLVLDEADHMFDMGFLPDLRRILKQLPEKRQNLLFSATMPDAIRHLADAVLVAPKTVQIDYRTPKSSVIQHMITVEQNEKSALLKRLLALETGTALVFTRTKHKAKNLAGQLERAGIPAASLQGNLSQTRRQQALEGFRQGRYRVLVATDIAARGIDVSGIGRVINFDIPDTVEAYTHRIGRTGRAGLNGKAYTFVSSADRKMADSIQRLVDVRIIWLDAEQSGLAGLLPENATGTPAKPSGRTTGDRCAATGRHPAGKAGRRGTSAGTPRRRRRPALLS